ncbi:MAG TPA: hypothetical protein VGJ70_22380 [Solirubrobacteraceae bacterium]
MRAAGRPAGRVATDKRAAPRAARRSAEGEWAILIGLFAVSRAVRAVLEWQVIAACPQEPGDLSGVRVMSSLSTTAPAAVSMRPPLPRRPF